MFKLNKWEKKLFLIVLCISSILLTLYFYISLYRGNQNSNRFLNKTTFRIPTVVEFRSARDPPSVETGNCIPTFNRREIDVHGRWQRVGTESDWHVYSAHVDSRLDNSPLVRILALSKGDTGRKLFCRIWYKSEKSSIAEVKKQELWIPAWDYAKQGQYYQPFLLTCPILPDPLAVSVVEKPCELPNNLLNTSILNETKDGTFKNFVVCLKPLDFDRDISFRLLEWLELQFLLGVDNVFVYIYNTHPQTWKVLKYFEKLGKVTIKNHDLPLQCTSAKCLGKQTKMKKVWEKRRHEMIIYNDCFYRHIHSHRFVVNLDLDEAIIPVIGDSWLELLQNAVAESPRLSHSASMAVRNVYFFEEFGAFNDTSVPTYMHMLRHLHRSANFTPPGFAQKSFFNTDLTLTVSNHFALQSLRPQVHVLSAISEHLAHLHHYRKDCPPLMEKDCEENYIKYRTFDNVLWKYKDKLVERVQTKAREIALGIFDELPLQNHSFHSPIILSQNNLQLET